jgi:hypothetical protein
MGSSMLKLPSHQGNYMQFVVKPETNVYEIEEELKTTFGTLLTDADIEALLNSLSIQSGMATNLSVVDLYPLYEEILARFQTRLHTDDGVMAAEAHILFTQANLEKEIVDRPTTHCTSQGGNGNSQGCKNKAIIQEAREAAETAAEAYYDLLSKKHNSMIDAGMLPIMDVSLEHQQQGREMFVETSLLVIGSIIPLTATDVAIEAATLGVGKFAKIANKAGDLLTRLKTGGMSSRAKSVSEEAAERIADARKAKKAAGTCSFHGDMLVKTNLGFSPIRDLRAGDQVWSRDEVSGQVGYKSVLAQYSNPYEETVSVTVQNSESGKIQTIISNRIHPYFVQLPQRAIAVSSSEGHVYQGEISNGAWVDAANLKAGFRLLNDDSTWAEVVSVKIELKPLQAFNLTVADYHTYFVAANDEADAVWVHNICGKLVNDFLQDLTDPKAKELLDDLVSRSDSGSVKGLDEWLGSTKNKSVTNREGMLSELKIAQRELNDNPGSVVRLDNDVNAPKRANGEDMQTMDITIETPEGSRHIEVFTSEKPVTTATTSIMEGFTHGAQKVNSRIADGSPVEGSREAISSVTLDLSPKTKKGNTTQLSEDGTVRTTGPQGNEVNSYNLFESVADKLNDPKSTPDRESLDAFHIMDNITGEILASYSRNGDVWSRVK